MNNLQQLRRCLCFITSSSSSDINSYFCVTTEVYIFKLPLSFTLNWQRTIILYGQVIIFKRCDWSNYLWALYLQQFKRLIINQKLIYFFFFYLYIGPHGKSTKIWIWLKNQKKISLNRKTYFLFLWLKVSNVHTKLPV